MSFYDGTRLRKRKDINGNIPEIYISTGNRSIGKTTDWIRFFVQSFLDSGEKFCCLYRFKNELENVSAKIFNDVFRLFFPEHDYSDSVLVPKNVYELWIDGKPCGYATSLNAAEAIKKNSHLMNDTRWIFFDEFISESLIYLPDEVTKLFSIHTSLARGNGLHVRYLPTVLCGNVSSVINPYFMELGIANKISPNTRFYSGEGFVLEQTQNVAAQKALENSAFGRAFSGSDYLQHASANFYLNDKSNFISAVKGGNYLLTLKYKNRFFGVRNLEREGFIYISQNADKSFPVKLAVTYDDCDASFTMRHYATYKEYFYLRFSRAQIRFSDVLAQNAAFELIQ